MKSIEHTLKKLIFDRKLNFIKKANLGRNLKIFAFALPADFCCFLCRGVWRALTCMSAIHILPNRYQSNPREKFDHFKGPE